MLRFSKILCPVDFDPNSSIALRTAAELAHERKATLIIIYVVPIPPTPEVALPFGKLEAAARSRLERLARQKAVDSGNYEIEVLMGDPGTQIVQAVKRRRADLVVMATHGRKGLRRLVLGSVAEKVVRDAPCPVLTVKPKITLRAASAKRANLKARA